MKNLSLLGAVLFLSTASYGAMCVPGSLDSYIGLGSTGCDLGAVRFDNFTVAAGQSAATPIDPSAIQISTGGTFYMPVLLFTLNATASGSDLLEAFFQFRASGPSLLAASIALNGATATGNGAVTGILDVCPDGNFAGGIPSGCSTTPASTVVFAIESTAFLSDSVNLAPSSFFDVFVDWTVDGGGVGTASLTSAEIGIAATPEPASWLLLAGGLSAIGFWRARRVL